MFKNLENKNIKLNRFFDKKKSIQSNILYFEKKLKIMDIIFLSYAKDGHIASLFNNLKPKISKKKVCYVINSKNKFKYRISVTKSFIERSKNKFLFFVGKEKKKIYYKIKNNKLKNDRFFKKFNIVLI